MQLLVNSLKNELYDNLSTAIDRQFGDVGGSDFTQYQADPVGFGENVLGEAYKAC